jgi:hypothetical protein
MRDVFSCSKCHSIYEIKRQQHRPDLPPRCQVCFASFPPSELGDWLSYERAEPESSVGEWLTGQPGLFALASPSQKLTIDPLPSTASQKFSSLGNGRASDER